MPDPQASLVSQALARLLDDASLRESLGQAGEETARHYAWERRIDALEEFLNDVAKPTRLAIDEGIGPEPRRALG